jgi:DNA-binding MarR family transcriptional regulator
VFNLTDALGVDVISVPWAGAGNLPYILEETYDFRKVTLDGTVCLFAEPRNEMPTVQAVARNFERVREAEPLPVVLKTGGLSAERRKALIAARIPFVAREQIYLPFMGAVLQDKLYAEPNPREKLMPSAQMLLFAYLYQNNSKLYPGKLTQKLELSAMQITRAVRQLQKMNLFEVDKDGVSVVIHGKTNHRALFEATEPYLLDPVKEILYINGGAKTKDLPFAGISALSRMTMLADDNVPAYAYHSRTDKLVGENVLSDRDRQVRVEIWKYAPALLSRDKSIADPLSVLVSLKGERDERVQQAAEDVLGGLWR